MTNTEHPNPFLIPESDGTMQEPEEFCEVDVAKQVDIDQLVEEIREIDGDSEIHVVLSLATDTEEPSKEHPAKLFVTGANESEVKKALKAHKPDPTRYEIKVDDVVKRLKDGENISLPEIVEVLRTLV